MSTDYHMQYAIEISLLLQQIHIIILLLWACSLGYRILGALWLFFSNAANGAFGANGAIQHQFERFVSIDNEFVK